MKKYFFIAIALLASTWATWTYSTSRNVHSIQVGEDGGLIVNVRGASGTQGGATATQAGLLNFYATETINLASSGDYTAGTALVTRIGNVVTVSGTGSWSHSSDDSPESAAVLPVWARPTTTRVNTYVSNTLVNRIIIFSDGRIATRYKNYSGTDTPATSTEAAPTITYVVID